MGVERAINYDDLRKLAKRRLPRIAFDFIEGGVDGEEGLETNFDAFSRQKLVPKYLIDTSAPDKRTTLFGRSYALPVGIAPTGAAALFRRNADVILARAARDADIPFIISGASTATIEQVAAVAPEHAWYQIYVAKDRRIAADMIGRAQACGLSTLVFTVDVPAGAKRERNIRNGMGRPMRPTLSSKVEALRHPGWLVEYFTGPGLTASNWEKYAPAGASKVEVLDYLATQFPSGTTWDDVTWIRKQWKGPLVIKGIMHPDDARRAAAMGVDGIMVSNHGARQLDRAPAPLDVLPAIRDAVGDKMTVMFDSGIRRGSDIATALCMGAKFCFVGRWTLYGVAAGADAGARHAVQMIATELTHVMTQLGTPDVASFGPDFLMWDDAGDLARNRRP
jgi:L-lactate dehydrogenase (cytochrome)/(S)-mandelate dehydrogenase